MKDTRKPRVLLFTQQLVGLGTRKTGMVFWAETFAKLGFETSVVTTQLSYISKVFNPQRFQALGAEPMNKWVRRGAIDTFIWVPWVHPVRAPRPWMNASSEWLLSAYASLLDKEICRVAAEADIIVIESCAAVALFERLKRAAPKAQFVYCASDRLAQVGMHPGLQKTLTSTASRYDLIRVPSPLMKGDFAVEADYIPHGVEKSVFDELPGRSHGDERKSAIVAGDMAFDEVAVRTLVHSFPDIEFHFFGRMNLAEFRGKANVVIHGEVPFEVLAGFVKRADVGIAPYQFHPGLDYLAESSLKLHQYTYCRLPTVAPIFAKGGRDHVFGYTPGSAASVVEAMKLALTHDRGTIDNSQILGWTAVVQQVLGRLGADQPCASDTDVAR
ncbi:glycosyltransferase family 4 protein [Flaviflagellibacter deserti]|uniref:Glucuronosyltransferase GumK N-terminal domain-containing protein n=1 Tax=Flaviflagellibacter deserti TaxID=2267266 RepID=A0ABV9Z949_9HYPH